MRRFQFLLIFVLILFNSCSKDDEADETSIVVPEVDRWEVNRSNQYALNVVLFVPTDFSADEVLVNEVSDVMLYIQKWYEKQMELNGFGKKTFGLITNQFGEVKVNVVNGQLASSDYIGNGNLVKSEINQYFDSRPTEKFSQHTFVLGQDNSGVPFYGSGKFAFATSSDFKLKSSGKFLDGLELMSCNKLGGIMHELGHGINLPHCAHKGSDLPKIALMSFGNHTYEQGKTDLVFLTKSSASILNVTETFNTRDKIYYDGKPEVNLGPFQIKKDDTNKTIIAEGILKTTGSPTHFYIGHNGYPHNGNSNAAYDEITFTVPLNSTGTNDEYTFQLEMPYSDLFNNYKDNEKDKIECTMVALFENGSKVKLFQFDYTMDLTTKIPNDDVLKSYEPFVFTDRSEWIVSANSIGPGSVLGNIIDASYDTFWHSAWQYSLATDGNHEISIDFGTSKQYSGVYLHSDRSGTQYRPKHLTLEISSDGLTWETKKEVSISSMSNARELKLDFVDSITSRYLKIIVDDVYSGNSEENLIFTEIDIYK